MAGAAGAGPIFASAPHGSVVGAFGERLTLWHVHVQIVAGESVMTAASRTDGNEHERRRRRGRPDRPIPDTDRPQAEPA